MERTLRRAENGHHRPRVDLLLAIAEETGTDLHHFTAIEVDEDGELRQRAREMIAPFQRGDGRRAPTRVPAARRRTDTA